MIPEKEKVFKSVDNLVRRLALELKTDFSDNFVSAVLFGSFARGDFHELSDIDLLLIFDELPSSFFQRSKLFDKVEQKVKPEFKSLREMGYLCQFMPVMKTRSEASYHSPLYLDMVEDAKILYDKGDFFKTVLSEIKQRLSELGAKRKYLKSGGWYWDLKPDYQYGEVIEI